MKRKTQTIKNVLSYLIPYFIIAILGFVKLKYLLSGLGVEIYALNQLFIQIFAYISILEGGIGVLITQAYYKYFADENVDFAVVECGMGGKGDATNVESKNISVITSVAVDHTAFLGNTVEEIAKEKSGIIKQECTCVLYPNPKCEKIIENVCNKNNSKLIKVDDTGNFLKNDIACAQAVLDKLSINIKAENPKLSARQSIVGGILVDGGHNEDAGMALKDKINNEVAVIAMMKDKNVDAYLSLVAPKCKTIYATQVNNSRSMKAYDLAEIAKKYCDDVLIFDDAIKAVDSAKQNNLSLVCGSFYLYREIRKELN